MDQKLLTLIDTAIKREEDAYTFYMAIHGKVIDPAVRETIQWIAGGGAEAPGVSGQVSRRAVSGQASCD